MRVNYLNTVRQDLQVLRQIGESDLDIFRQDIQVRRQTGESDLSTVRQDLQVLRQTGESYLKTWRLWIMSDIDADGRWSRDECDNSIMM